MSEVFLGIPQALKKKLRFYRRLFTKPQFKHFSNFVSGLIINNNKTIQDINDSLSEKDQSSLNRFLTKSDWDTKKLNSLRIKQVKKCLRLNKGIFIGDDTFLHKTGHHIEKAYYYRSGKTKRKEWGHSLVNSIFTDDKDNTFPISAGIYLRKEVCIEDDIFKTKRELLLEQLDFALENELPLWLAIIDSGYYAHDLMKKLKQRNLKYLAGVHMTNKAFFDYQTKDEQYTEISKYIERLTEKDYDEYMIKGEKYFIHTNEIFIKQLDKQKLIISFKEGDEVGGIKAYISNIFDKTNKQVLILLLKRWKVEGWHRDAKQHLGLESYQVRKYRAVQKYVYAILLAYTLLVLNKEQSILKPLKRKLQTIGEMCRFFKLLAQKGTAWLKRKVTNLIQLKRILNKYVLVKNAKA